LAISGKGSEGHDLCQLLTPRRTVYDLQLEKRHFTRLSANGDHAVPSVFVEIRLYCVLIRKEHL
jgi:hypothetical protein